MNRERSRVPAPTLGWIVPAILVLGVAAATLAVGGYGQETGARTTEALVLARGAAGDLNRFLQSQLATVKSIAAADPVVDGDPAAMRAYFDRLDPASIGFDGEVFWVGEDGVMRARSDYDGEPIDFSDREWVDVVLRTDRPYVSNARVGQLNEAPIIVFAVPTRDRSGARTGVLGAATRLDLSRARAFSLQSAGGAATTVIDRVGQLIAAPGPVSSLEPVAGGFPFEALRASGEGVLTDATGPTGLPDRLVGYAAVPAGDWLLALDQPVNGAFGPARDRLLGQLALIVGFTALAIVVTGWSYRRTSEALRRQEEALAAEQAASTRLAVLVDELREREELRDAFVGVLSHELRTPATTIYGMTAVLARSPDRADRAAIVEDIRDEADRLNRIIEDLLVLSRAERGVLAVESEPVLVQRVVPQLAADLARRYPGVELVVDLPPALPPVVAEDGAVRQVLYNLLANAAKYGSGTPVRLRAEPGPGVVRLVVSDEGPGFPAEDAERLFELYYRSPRTARQAAGTGIGLFVVRQLVEGMGGSVSASTGPSGGATFVVTLQAFGSVSTEDEAAAAGT